MTESTELLAFKRQTDGYKVTVKISLCTCVSTELLAFKRQTDGYKVTVKISLCTCVVLSWDKLKVRQKLLASDYEIYMLYLCVATVY